MLPNNCCYIHTLSHQLIFRRIWKKSGWSSEKKMWIFVFRHCPETLLKHFRIQKHYLSQQNMNKTEPSARPALPQFPSYFVLISKSKENFSCKPKQEAALKLLLFCLLLACLLFLCVEQAYSAAGTMPQRDRYSVKANKLFLKSALCWVLLLLKDWMHTSAPPLSSILYLLFHTVHLLWQQCLPAGLDYQRERKRGNPWNWNSCSIVSSLELWFVSASGRIFSINDIIAGCQTHENIKQTKKLCFYLFSIFLWDLNRQPWCHKMAKRFLIWTIGYVYSRGTVGFDRALQ